MNQRENQASTVVQYATAPEAAAPAVRAPGLSPGVGRYPTLLSRALARPVESAEQAAEMRGEIDRHVDPAQAHSLLDDFLRVSDLVRELEMWFGADALLSITDVTLLFSQIQRDIAWIDRCVSNQINQILHHPDFQKLEGSWRGLSHLANCQDRWTGATSTIKVLNATWHELRSDFENATEYDQSEIYWKVHQEGIGQAGAFPFTAMLLDFAIHPKPTREHPCDDIEVLTRLAEVGQAAFCPMVANADPSMFEEVTFAELRAPKGAHDSLRREQDPYEQLHNSLGFFRWKKFRSEESARFMSLALPRMLMRRPYRASQSRYFGFGFDEEVRNSRDFVWGGAAFGVGEVLLRAFSEGSWFADIRGAQRGSEHGGRVFGPTYDSFETEPRDVSTKPVTETVISDDFERSLSRLGFMPLCACKDLPVAAFYSAATAQKPTAYNDDQASFNARISSMLNYMLCASRFAHYLKIISRDRIGSCNGPEELERMLQNWLADYICDSDAALSIRAEKPLRDAQIKVWAVPGTAGEFKSVMHVAPHFGFEDVNALVVLKDQKLVKR